MNWRLISRILFIIAFAKFSVGCIDMERGRIGIPSCYFKLGPGGGCKLRTIDQENGKTVRTETVLVPSSGENAGTATEILSPKEPDVREANELANLFAAADDLGGVGAGSGGVDARSMGETNSTQASQPASGGHHHDHPE